MDIIDLLRRDHQRLLFTARAIAQCTNADVSRRLFQHFRIAWTAQWRAEESVVFAAVHDDLAPGAQDLVFKCDVEHRIIRQWAADMAQLRSGTPSWSANALALRDLVDYHLNELQLGLLPRLRRIGPLQRRWLGLRYELLKRCLAIKCRARGPEPYRPAPRTIDMKKPPLHSAGGGSGTVSRRVN